MSEKVKRNFARFYKLRYSRFNIFDACFTTIVVLLFITLLRRPAPVRPEHGLDRCGSHYLLFGSPKRPAGGLPPSHRPANYLNAENAESAEKRLIYTHNAFLQSPVKAGRWSGASHWPAEIKQPVRIDNYTKDFTGKAGEVMGRAITRPPAVSDWLDKLITKIYVVESGGRLNPPDGDGGRAVGALQLHKCVIDDVNFYYGQNFTYTDRHDLNKAKQIAKLYIAMWMHKQREEIAARIFNGGPRGWQKKSTDKYWQKIQKTK